MCHLFAVGDRGQTLGFEKKDGQLLAVAGDTATPLVEAHYEWKTAPGEPVTRLDFAFNEIGRVVGAVVVVAVVGALMFLGLVASLDG